MPNQMGGNKGQQGQDKIRCQQCNQDFQSQQQLQDHNRQMHQNR